MTTPATATIPGRGRAGRLELTREEMRRLGYRAVDAIIEHIAGLPDGSIGRTAGRDELERLLGEPLPARPGDPEAILEQATRDVLGNILYLDHPRCFAFIPSPNTFVGVLADALVAGFNPFAGTWLEASGPAQVELITIGWLRELIGLPESAGGLFVSGGSEANLTALAVARTARLGELTGDAVIYTSDQAHASVLRGARTLGFRDHQIRRLASDPDHRLVARSVLEAIAEDRGRGRQPFAVVASAGTTNTGAVDPLVEIGAISRAEGLWMHVDGAYGAAAVFSRRHASLLAGIAEADSVTIDPHKWLFQPYEIGCVIVRDHSWLPKTFAMRPEYLRDVDWRDGTVDFADHGLKLTRSFRALKLWLSLKVFGSDAFGEAIDHGFALAERAEAWLRDTADWNVVSPAGMGIVCFRYEPPRLSPAQVDAVTDYVVEATLAEGHAMVGTTVLAGRPVLRLCTINPRTTEGDVLETLGRLDRHARSRASA